MLQFLPLEILNEILHDVLYPLSYTGYYLDNEEGHQWAQRDGLNLAATCRLLRMAFMPKLWGYTCLDITGHRKTLLPRSIKFFPENFPRGFRPNTSFLTCLWSTEAIPEPGHSRIIMNYERPQCELKTVLRCLKSLDPPLSYVRVFKIGIRNRFGSIDGYGVYQSRYELALGLVNPQMMPKLRDLILETALHKPAEHAHLQLGRAMGTFENKINLTLVGITDPDGHEGGRRIFASVADFIKLMRHFGWAPFLTNFPVPSAGCKSTETGEFVLNVTGLRFRLPCCFKKCQHQISLSYPFGGSKAITRYDVTTYPISNGPLYSKLPSSVKVLQCTSSYMFAVPDDEVMYEVTDNVRSLTIQLNGHIMIHPHGGIPKYHFRNLTELQVYSHWRVGRRPAPEFYKLFCALLETNKKSLVSLRIGSLYREEYDQISAYFDLLETLDYGLLLRMEEESMNAEVLANTISKWGPNLRQISCLVECFDSTYERPPPRPEPHLDYEVLRSNVLSRPKLQFHAVELFCPDVLNNLRLHKKDKKLLKGNPIDEERYLFGDTFKNSQDSKNFSFTDFCEVPDPNVFAHAFAVPNEKFGTELFPDEYYGDNHDEVFNFYEPPPNHMTTNFFLNFTKLRALIKKSEDEVPSLAVETLSST